MEKGIFGLIGVFLGGLITNFGIIYQNKNLERRDNRAVYIEFASVINRGIRLLEDIERLERDIKENRKRIKKATNKRDLVSIEHHAKKSDIDLENVQFELSQFLLGMDLALAKFQFHAPIYLLKYGRLLRDGVDECARGEIRLDQVKSRYKDFVFASRFALNGKTIGKIADKIIYLGNKKSKE